MRTNKQQKLPMRKPKPYESGKSRHIGLLIPGQEYDLRIIREVAGREYSDGGGYWVAPVLADDSLGKMYVTYLDRRDLERARELLKP